MLIPTEYLTGNFDIAKSPLEILLDEEDARDISWALVTLTPREERVVRLRFGLYRGPNLTLDQTGEIFGVTRERIRQIEAKALRKLKHPERSRNLRLAYERTCQSAWWNKDKMPARHYVPEWKKPIMKHVKKWGYPSFPWKRFMQGKTTTQELTDYFNNYVWDGE